MSRFSHTPPMPTHADLMLAEKLRRELGAASNDDADTQPENVTHLPAIETITQAPVEVPDPNKQYAPLAAPPKRAEVKTEPMANVILGVTLPPQRPPASRPPSQPAVHQARRATTTPGRKKATSFVIPMERRGVMIGFGIVLAAGMAAAGIFVVGASLSSAPAQPTVATTTMATVATTTMATVATPAVTVNAATSMQLAPAPEPFEPVASAPPPRPRPERSERPVNTASAPSTAHYPATRATNSAAVVEPPPENTKDDIERKIR